MTLESIKQAIHKLELISKPYELYANPSDATMVKDLIPDIVKLVEVPYVEKGKFYLMDRKAFEDTRFKIHTIGEWGSMTDEETIANESYHTCGRCKYDTLPESMYPCNQCIHSQDTRKDLWVYKGESEDN